MLYVVNGSGKWLYNKASWCCTHFQGLWSQFGSSPGSALASECPDSSSGQESVPKSFSTCTNRISSLLRKTLPWSPMLGHDYCNVLYVGLLLNSWFRMPKFICWWTLRGIIMWLILWELHQLPVQFKVLFISYKALHSLEPEYRKDWLLLHVLAWPLRSTEGSLLYVPPLAEARDRAFSVLAPQLWNFLPVDIHLTPSMQVFRKSFKK